MFDEYSRPKCTTSYPLTCQRILILHSEGYRLLIRLSNTFTQPSGMFSNETSANPF